MGSAAAPLPSFPRKRESRTVLRQTIRSAARHFGIPAYAGMTVGAALRPRQASKILSILFIHVKSLLPHAQT